MAHLPGLGTDMVARLLWDSHATDKAAAPRIELNSSLRVPSSSFMYSVESMFADRVLLCRYRAVSRPQSDRECEQSSRSHTEIQGQTMCGSVGRLPPPPPTDNCAKTSTEGILFSRFKFRTPIRTSHVLLIRSISCTCAVGRMCSQSNEPLFHFTVSHSS